MSGDAAFDHVAPDGASLAAHVGPDALAALADEWAFLFARCPEATPFQHPAWAVAWARHLAGGTPWALTLRRRGRLTALLPLHTRPDGLLELLGAPITDYRDALVETGARDAAGPLLAAALAAPDIRAAELGDLRPGSALADAAPPPGWHARLEPCEVCPVVPLPPGARLVDLVSARLGDDLDRFRRRLERRGALEVRHVSPAAAAEAVEWLIALHGAQWETRGEPGVLADERVQQVHREAAPGLAAAGLLEATALVLDGAIVALVYGFAHGARSYFYLSGFDPAWARLSPGTLAIAAAFERALGRGARAVSFLRGAEPYKYRWGARDEQTVRRTFVREDA